MSSKNICISSHLERINPETAATHSAHLSEMFHAWKESKFTENNRHDRDVWTTFVVVSEYLRSITLQSFDEMAATLEIPHENE